MINKHLYRLFNIILLLISAHFINSCANPVPPTGGEIDRTPPKVMNFSPPNKMVNFKSPSIQLEFDEYIQNVASIGNIIISPSLEKAPKISTKGKKLKLDFEEELSPNTTYTINFGDAIKDFNEGNVLEGLTYVFSTGPFLDSLTLKGKIVNAFDNGPVENIIVALYKENKDSILVKSKPDYFVKTTAQGMFSFNYLKEGIYFIAALDDKNMNYIFDQSTESVAFETTPIYLTENTTLSQPLVLFKETEKIKKTDVLSKQPGKVSFVLNQPIDFFEVKTNFKANNDIININNTRDTITYWYSEVFEGSQFYLNVNNELFDTTKVKMLPLDTLNAFIIKDNKSFMPINQSYRLYFSTPMSESIDFDKITFSDEEEQPYSFDLKFISSKIVDVKFDKEVGKNYSLLIKEGAFSNYAGLPNKDVAFNVTIAEKEDLPNILISINIKEEANYVLELLNQDKKLLKTTNISSKTNLTFENQEPGKYFIKVYKDINGNGKWDTGNYKERKQPEPVVYFSPSFELRNNWDKDFSIDLQ
jgi:uncharacterized protein (DUF2141 family)